MNRSMKYLALSFLCAFACGARAADALPKGWIVAGSKPANYEFGVDTAVTQESSRSAYIRFRAQVQDVGGFGTLMQTIAPDAYRGKRIRLSGLLKTQNANTAQMWMRVDGPNATVLGFDNMNNRLLNGTSDWKRYDIVLDVPVNGTAIAFGFLLEGTGEVWADAFRLEEVGMDTPVTGGLPRVLPKAPANLNFEE